jgi:polysaccharide chain length determinant protein (PEP-CTERM system associated)
MNTQHSQVDILNKYANLFISRYKLIVACLLLTVSASPIFYLNIPRTYQSSASIIYKEQNINPSRMAPDEGMQVREMVNTVTQQVLSRTNLEKIIKSFNLYPDLRKIVPIEDTIEKLRDEDIEVNVQRDRGNVFSVSFRGTDPQTVMKVTNELAAKFIEENMRVREERAKATASYIQDELRMSKETLHNKESQMRDYKLQFYNEMPDQRAANMNRLNALQEQFQAIQSSIHDREQTRLLVAEQLEIRKKIQSAAAGPDSEGYETEIDRLWNELETARNARQELLARYTNEHPNVKRIEKQISQLESELKKLKEPDSGTAKDGQITSDDRIQELSLQLKEIELDLKILREQSESNLNQINTYQKWIEAAPIHEAEWSSLTRDYDELKRYHDTLLSQSLAAEAASSLERHQKGSQFKVIDPAYLPITPDKGPFRIIFLASIAIGLATGMGLVLGMDIIDTSFKDKKEIEDFLQLPVTCALPLLVTETEKKRKRTTNIIWNCFFAIWLLALIGATIYFRHLGLLIL